MSTAAVPYPLNIGYGCSAGNVKGRQASALTLRIFERRRNFEGLSKIDNVQTTDSNCNISFTSCVTWMLKLEIKSVIRALE